MADDPYGEFKVVSVVVPGSGSTAFRFRPRRVRDTSDYSSFKATVESAMESAVEKLKLEMAAQHEQTRAEVRASRRDVLGAIKESPVEYVKIQCEFGAVFLVFCLMIHFTLKIELVNTTFAVFMLIACGVYWSMARLKQNRRPNEKPLA